MCKLNLCKSFHRTLLLFNDFTFSQWHVTCIDAIVFLYFLVKSSLHVQNMQHLINYLIHLQSLNHSLNYYLNYNIFCAPQYYYCVILILLIIFSFINFIVDLIIHIRIIIFNFANCIIIFMIFIAANIFSI